MKIIIRRTLSIIMCLVLFLFVMFYAQENCFILDDTSVWRTKNFFREKQNTLDAVFIGSSEVFAGYYPGLAYKEIGITSYPFALDSQSVEIWKSQVIETNKRQNPKQIFIEISGALYEEDDRIYDDASLRRYSDNIPFSLDKVRLLNECTLSEDILSYYFPIIKYHGDIFNARDSFQIKKYYDKYNHDRLRGIATYTDIDNNPLIQRDMALQKPINPNAKKLLVDFLDYCKQNNISNIVFTRFPHKFTCNDDYDLVYIKNTVKQIIKEYGFDFIDLEEKSDEIGLDFNNDFYNKHHLNVYGAEKTTKYLCDIIRNQYSISNSKLNDKQKDEWYETSRLTQSFIDYSKQLIKDKNVTMLYDNNRLIETLKEYIDKET